MNTLRMIIGLTALAIVILSMAAAQAAAQAEIKTSVDDLNRIISYGLNVTIYINDTAAAQAGKEYVNMAVIVAGAANYNVKLSYNSTSGLYEALLMIRRIGTTDKAEVYATYYNYTGNNWATPRKLIGTLARDGDTLVIQYTPYGTNETVEATLTYKLVDIVVQNRLHMIAGEEYYWIPRLHSSIASLYNAEGEWRVIIPGYTGSKANVTITITDQTTGYSTSATVEFTRIGTTPFFKPTNSSEAQKITEMLLNVSSQLSSPWWIKGVDYANPQYRGDIVTVQARIENTGQTSKTRKIALFISDAVVEINAVGPTKDITITVYDADENLDTTSEETALSPVELLNASFDAGGAVIANVTVQETGKATGVFTAKFNMLDMPSIWKTVIGPRDNVLDWHFSDLRLDNRAIQLGQIFCDKFGSEIIPYHTANFYIVEDSVALRYAQRCCPIPKLTMVIEDTDADTGEAMVLRAEVPAGSIVYKQPLYLVRNGVPTTIAGYKITIYVNATKDNESKLFNVTTKEPLTIAFYSSKRGKIEFDLDLTKLNWTQINEQVTSQGYQISSIVVMVTDCMALNADGEPEPQTQTDSAVLQKVRIELERTTLPVAYLEPNVDVKPGDAQVDRITIYDNGSNVDCCQVDTIPASKIQLELVKIYQGQVMVKVTGTGMLNITLYDVNPDGTRGNARGYCVIEVSDLVETAANTGVFKGKIEIYSVVDGVRYAGCPSPWLHGAKLYVTYVSPSIGSDTKEVTFEFMDADIKIYDMDGNEITEAVMGTPVRVVVTDPDANLDNAVNESVRVKYTLQGMIMSGEGYIWVAQTDSSSDKFDGSVTLERIGITEDPLYIDMNLVANNTGNSPTSCSGCFSLTFTYTDKTPYDQAGIQSAENVLPTLKRLYGTLDWLAILNYQCVQMMTKQYSIAVNPVRGSVSISYTVNDTAIQAVMKDEIGTAMQDVTNKTGIPALNKTIIVIDIEDADQNFYADRNETKQFQGWITVNGFNVQIPFSMLNITFTEYAPGKFESNPISLQAIADALNALLSPQTPITVYQLAGKKIDIVYQDPMAQCPATPGACAQAAALVQVFTNVVDETGNVTIVDGVTGKPKDFYQCACPFGGACPTGGDLLQIDVEDISLVDYFPSILSTTSGPFSILIEKLTGVVTANPNPVTFTTGSDMVGLMETEDGVYIPYVKYTALGRLYCFPQTGSGIIVAQNGENVTVVYKDPANETGQMTDVAAKAYVGTPPIEVAPNEASNVSTVSLFKVEGNRFIPVEVLPSDMPSYVQISLQYDTNVMRTVLQRLGGGDVFYVMYFVKDADGNLVAFGFKPVMVGDTTVGFGFAAGELAPGQYTIEVVAALSPDNPVPLSPAFTATITVS